MAMPSAVCPSAGWSSIAVSPMSTKPGVSIRWAPGIESGDGRVM
jgi:hypothetical protein